MKNPRFSSYFFSFINKLFMSLAEECNGVNIKKIIALKYNQRMCNSHDFYGNLRLKPAYAPLQGLKKTKDRFQ